MKDLVLLVADKNAQFALIGALNRPEAMGTRAIEFEFRVHPGRDGGVRKTGADLLSLERRRFAHALMVLDWEGCGSAQSNAEACERELDARLETHWGAAAKSIVIAPELDAWVWGGDHAIESAIGWPPGERLRDWMKRRGYQFEPNGKPLRPKEGLEAALQEIRIPRSSALYKSMAGKISLRRCGDPAFVRLRHQLEKWFPR